MVYITWFAWTKPMRSKVVSQVCLYGLSTTCFMYMATRIFAESRRVAAGTGGDGDRVAAAGDARAVKGLFVVLIIAVNAGLAVVGGAAIVVNVRAAQKAAPSSARRPCRRGTDRRSVRSSARKGEG